MKKQIEVFDVKKLHLNDERELFKAQKEVADLKAAKMRKEMGSCICNNEVMISRYYLRLLIVEVSVHNVLSHSRFLAAIVVQNRWLN